MQAVERKRRDACRIHPYTAQAQPKDSVSDGWACTVNGLTVTGGFMLEA